MSSIYNGDQELPDQGWEQNIRSSYGTNFTFFGVTLVLLIGFVMLIMILIRCLSDLFRVERRPSQMPDAATKRPNSVKLVWNTLWEQPLPPGNYRSQAHGLHSTSTHRLADSEHASLYMTEH